MLGEPNDQIMGDSTDEETKVDVEKTSVQLNCVKNELAEEVVKLEENLHVTQYRVTPENIFGAASCKREVQECDGNLIGFLDNDAIIENVVIKLETIKEEDRNFIYCNKCNGNYKGFCLKCSTLSHILNNAAPPTSPESEINTVPKDILEIRDILAEKGVFLLQTLPKNIIFGQFEGMSAMRNAERDGWKINNKRLENVENGNWMKNIAYATSASTKNLDIFQMKGHLYFQTNREIMEGEELLVYYDDEEVEKLDNSQECYFIPRKQEDLPKIFACTLCCLGFQLVKCLMEHKRKCPHTEHNTDMKDLELVECHCCKIWVEKQEHQKHHMGYCWEKYLRMSYLQTQPVDRNQVKVEEIEDGLDTEAVHGRFKCSQYSYKTNDEMDLQRHLNTHKKPFQCNLCKTKFTQKSHLTSHIKNKHAENGCPKDYQCSECTYQTNDKRDYQNHLNVHRGIKPFECGICKMTFTLKKSLKSHITNKHSDSGCAKDYQCSECTYQTNVKQHYQNHINRHRGIKPFACCICKANFRKKESLKRHIKNKHTENGCPKDYQCSECTYQSNVKQHYQNHLNVHRGCKPFECGICQMKFTQKGTLRKHIKNKHAENECAKDYQCSECTYQTNDKQNYQRHLNGHRGIKPFECGICKAKFISKESLRVHIKNKHAENGCAKNYQCSECTYQSNVKQHYQSHLNGHRGIKPFECGICKAKFIRKESLKRHIKNKHAENGCAKDYQCSECTYETNDKQHYQRHLNGHRGIKPFECGICKAKFIRKESLKRHIKNKHAENGCAKDYQCSECTYQTNDKHNYQRHQNGHRGVKPFECGICKTKFTKKVSLRVHIKNKQAENECAKDYQCLQCTFQPNYHNHLNGHRGIIKPFECGICMMKFTEKGNLKKHIKNKHAESKCAKDYQCSECIYETSVKQLYQAHLNGHRGIKPFECGICKTKFAYKHSLKKHIKNKHAESECAKDYRCSECTYQTNDKIAYHNHLNRHLGIKPFECAVCKTKFRLKHTLKMHIKNTHAENGCANDYQCSECTYQTSVKQLYQNHLSRHRGIKPFECGICNAKFRLKHTLKMHIKNKHAENVSLFTCNICKKEFTHKSSLNFHIAMECDG